MPSISKFFGIIIYLYTQDHNPPHFHAIYNDEEILVSIIDLRILQWNMKPKALWLIMERARLNQDKLMEDRNLMTEEQELKQIPPLE